MSQPSAPQGPENNQEDTRPFVAPCRTIAPFAPLRWLAKGWADFRAAPRVSFVYGTLMVLLSYAITLATWQFGNMGLYMSVGGKQIQISIQVHIKQK